MAKKKAKKKTRWVQDHEGIYMAEGDSMYGGKPGDLVVARSKRGWDALFEPFGGSPITLGSAKSLGAAKTLAQAAIGAKKRATKSSVQKKAAAGIRAGRKRSAAMDWHAAYGMGAANLMGAMIGNPKPSRELVKARRLALKESRGVPAVIVMDTDSGAHIWLTSSFYAKNKARFTREGVVLVERYVPHPENNPTENPCMKRFSDLAAARRDAARKARRTDTTHYVYRISKNPRFAVLSGDHPIQHGLEKGLIGMGPAALVHVAEAI